MDLTLWWREHRWVALLELIEQMPTACRWREAMSKDVQYARAAQEVADADPTEPPPWSPSWREYDLNALQQREIINLLMAIGEGLGVLKSPSPFPGPTSGFDIARREQMFSMRDHILAQTHPDPETR